MELLKRCQLALAATAQELLQIVFTLAQDDWAEVAAPSLAYLRSSGVASTSGRCGGSGKALGGGLPPDAMDKVVHGLMSGLPASLQEGSEAGMLQARRLVTALQVVLQNHCIPSAD